MSLLDRRVRIRSLVALVGSILAGLALPAGAAGPNAIVTDAGCASNLPTPAPNGSVALPFAAAYQGTTYSSLWVNADGSVTFNGPSGPTVDGTLPMQPIIAPFFASTSGGAVTYGTISFGGRTAFCVNWLDMSGISVSGENSFQLLLVDRSDISPGDFDAIFNYDKIEWDSTQSVEMICIDPMDPNTCMLVPHFAVVGYNTSTGAGRFEFPGSDTPGHFLDTNDAGLTHNSSGTLQLGRYRFELGGTAAVEGDVVDASSGTPLGGGNVQLCPVPPVVTGCQVATAGATGHYAFLGLAAGDYAVTAFPVDGVHTPASVSVGGLAAAQVRTVNVALPVPNPMPPGTTLSPSHTSSGVPIVNWGNPLVLSTMGCPTATATWAVRVNGVVVPGRSGFMAESPPGKYSVAIPAMQPTHGPAEVVIVLTCPGGGTSTVDFNVYIDPSGVVKDTTGTLLVGATVTLYRSDQSGGPFAQVPNGDAIMSPANRVNPDLTDAFGHFGWDVIAGYYKVRATKAGCHDPANPGQAFVETAVMTIPPPVTNLELVLACPLSSADFNPLTPARILDTRDGTGGIAAKVGPASAVDVTVAGVGGVPATGVGAVVVNVTVTEPTAASWLSVFPSGQPLPLASNLNFVPGQDVPNLVVAKVGANGKVTVYTSVGSTHVVFDVVGWFAAGAPSFTSLTPARILDTRVGTGGIATKVGPATPVEVTVAGVGGVPASGVGAVVLNVTVTEPTAHSWLSVFPSGQALPLASNLNFVPGQDVPNLVVAKVGANGNVTVYNSAGSTHVVFDVVGWFADPPTSFTPLTPARVLDTRFGTGGISTKVGQASPVEVTVVGVGGVPATGVGAVVLNVTVTEPTAQSWLSVFPSGQPLPLASNLNFVPGQDVPNLVVAKVGANGKVTVYNSVGSTHVVFDVVGWFAV